MKVLGVIHAQVNVAPDELRKARAFYLDFMGMKEIPRPPIFRSDGFWFHAGGFETHIGVEENVDRRATRAHLAYEVEGLSAWREKIQQAGLPIKEQPRIPGYDRFHFRDPFGNNIELIQRASDRQ
jgi:catechol 2,3-dioxygenase-like lactoylglutathione lyase family enzyme